MQELTVQTRHGEARVTLGGCSPAPRLDESWLDVTAQLAADQLAGLPLVTGGRSSGARVACRTAAAAGGADRIVIGIAGDHSLRSDPGAIGEAVGHGCPHRRHRARRCDRISNERVRRPRRRGEGGVCRRADPPGEAAHSGNGADTPHSQSQTERSSTQIELQ